MYTGYRSDRYADDLHVLFSWKLNTSRLFINVLDEISSFLKPMKTVIINTILFHIKISKSVREVFDTVALKISIVLTGTTSIIVARKIRIS